MFRFFLPQFNTAGTSGAVGGSITSVEMSGYMGELFYSQVAAPAEGTGAVVQYRKLFVVNNYENPSTETRAWLDAEHTPGQIAISLQTGGPGVGTANEAPAGLSDWASPTNYAEGIDLGTLAINGFTGIWLRQTLTNIESSNPYTSLRLYVGGLVE